MNVVEMLKLRITSKTWNDVFINKKYDKLIRYLGDSTALSPLLDANSYCFWEYAWSFPLSGQTSFSIFVSSKFFGFLFENFSFSEVYCSLSSKTVIIDI